MNYLVAGPEEYLKYRFLEGLKKSAMVGGKQSEFNFEAFRAGVSEIAKILGSCNTLPFLSEHRIVVVSDAEKFSPGERDSILKYLRSPLDTTILVFLTPLNRFNKFLLEISGFTKVIRCDRLKSGELNLWIRREFAERKKKISPRLASLTSERIGDDLFRLKNEIEKISSFAGEAAEIGERHIEMASCRPAYETAFELVDLVLAKKPDRIFPALESLLTKEKPHRVLSLLAWQFRNLMKVKNLPEGLSADELSRELAINRYIAGKTKERARHLTRSDLKRKLETILEGDLFIKRGTMLARDALERVLVGLVK
jgi:DNA polymerase-3 subunit delta